MDYDVVIAGAGPVGLLLACELRLAGVSVLVLEKLADPNLPIKEGPVGARALNIPSIEVFYRRGLLPALKKAALKWIDLSISGEGIEAAVRGLAPSLDSGAISKPGKIPPRSGSIFGTMLDANVVDYGDPEFAARGSGIVRKGDGAGNFTCSNANLDDDGSMVFAFHDSRRCVIPDLDHGWANTHREANFNFPNDTLFQSLMDGFVRINDQTEQIDNGQENATDDQTMAFYNQNEIPFYYDMAQKFAVNDRYFSPVIPQPSPPASPPTESEVPPWPETAGPPESGH